MGWLYTRGQTKEELVKHLLSAGENYKAIDHSLVGNHLWAAFECTKPELVGQKFICLFLLASHRDYGWGYKDIEETCGPCETDCPLRLLDLVPDPGSYATAWREKVRAAHAAKGLQSTLIASLKPGIKIKLRSGCSPQYLVIMSTTPLRGYGDNGILYRVRRGLVAEIVS